MLSEILQEVKSIDLSIATLILFAYIITDALYAKYTLDVANHNEYKAASTGAVIHLFIAFGVINYTHNWIYIIPLAIGSWIGTFMMVRKERIKKEKKLQKSNL